MKVLIIIPVFNEEKNIEHVLDSIEAACPHYDVLVIDDGSIDHSYDLIRQRNKEAVVRLPSNLCIGGARQTGYKYAFYHQYDIVVQVDGDGQHNPLCIEKMIEKLKQGYNVCIGSRFITYEGFQSSGIRRIGISFLYGLLKCITGEKITDPTSGFRVCDRKAIEFYAFEYPLDYPEAESIVTASRNKMKLCEAPVAMEERKSGKSSIGKRASVYYMIKVTIAILIEAIGKNKKKKI